MTEPIVLGLIGSFGTFLTIVGAIIQQGMALKKSSQEQQAIKKVTNEVKETTDETRQENKEGFDDLKALIMTQNSIIDLILRDRLRYLLKSHQGKTEVSYADKEIIVEMFKIYDAKGHNGTIKSLFEAFDKLPVN